MSVIEIGRRVKALGRSARLRWRTRNGFKITDTPAFDPETDAWFRQRIATARAYVEFGSGASTLLAARAGVPTVSVESDARYAAAVRAALPAGSDTHLLAVDIGLTEDWGYPVFTRPTPARVDMWRGYPTAPFALLETAGHVPDLVLVDGRFRVACALAMRHWLAQHGANDTVVDLLFDDYAGRRHYHSVEQWLGAPTRVGRAALFTVTANTPVPDETSVSEAMRDFR